ncbi:putative lipase/esterase [Chthoniobacter flavus Ellin428]|uniref:Putative lipase/esterase n=1 Tax=Chthoniobacter flavus Ellin428 TaxID=497964 RepID=B4DC25_9BACT|nr:alpha/beta hydrolase [Chthoniobacter flavus]EDY15999.1 putative lipase/esterase [Chthoniobacter flavus Ellin428]TCO85256.1 acetyl esterase/lipase [Chthoniobacter flavus]
MNIPFPRILVALSFSALLALRAINAEPTNYHPTLADVRYGKYDRDVLDFFRADTKNPAPVLIYFHGGGWIGGDKKSANPTPFLRAGISLVAADYRFTTGTPDAAPYPAPMLDSARVVQFVRSKAEEWHIDPNRVALTGASAGAVISMWIAYREDLAKPDSADPVERFSTHVTCILPQIGPTTFDPKLILQRVGGPPSIHPALLPFFNVKSIAELDTPEKQKLIADASPLNLVTKDAPPTFMQYASPLGGTPLPPQTSVNVSIHHAEFGRMLKEKLDALGVENVLQTKDDGSDPQAMWTFLFKHLKPESAPAGK